MTEATQATASKSKPKPAVGPAATSFPFPKFEAPGFDMPKMEIPAAFREFAEKGISQAKENYEKMKSVAEEATDVLEETYCQRQQGRRRLRPQADRGQPHQHQCGVRLLQRAPDREVLCGSDRAFDRACAQAVRDRHGADQGPRLARAEGGDRYRRADQGQRLQDLQQGRLTRRRQFHVRPFSVGSTPGPTARAFCFERGVQRAATKHGRGPSGLAKAGAGS